MRKTINGTAFCQMMIAAAASIELQKQHVNELNVFPVPDGDTGTNMSMTIGAAAAELKKSDASGIGRAAEIAAGALLRGARGNSGVILSLLFRGFAKYLKEMEEADGFDFACALSEGVDAAYKAVMKPAEGTILTVSRVASDHAIQVSADNTDMEFVLEEMIRCGYTALAETINQNPVLKKANVVDAGAKGFLIILEGMLNSLKGVEITVPEAEIPSGQSAFSMFATEDITFTYCTEFIVSRDNEKDPFLLRGFLSDLGDSLVLVDDDEIIKVHVHTNNPGLVLEESLTYGSIITVKIENMRQQHTSVVINEAVQEEPKREIAPAEKQYGFVSVCAGDGLTSIFRDLGVDGIIQGGQTMNPSTEDILLEIDKTPSEVVFVFPNNKNIIMAAQQCVALSEKKVIVIPTKTIPQGITALLAMDSSADLEQNVKDMTLALKKVTTMQITYAARSSEFDGRAISEGEYIALKENSLFGSDPDILTLAQKLAQDTKKCEYITIFYGDGVTEKQAQEVADQFLQYCPDAEISLLFGGQPVYYYLISAE